jgi:hypothetical protein
MRLPKPLPSRRGLPRLLDQPDSALVPAPALPCHQRPVADAADATLNRGQDRSAQRRYRTGTQPVCEAWRVKWWEGLHRLDQAELDLVRDLIGATLDLDRARFDDLVRSSGLAERTELRADVIVIVMWMSYYAMYKRRLTFRIPNEQGRRAAVDRVVELPMLADVVDHDVAAAGVRFACDGEEHIPPKSLSATLTLVVVCALLLDGEHRDWKAVHRTLSKRLKRRRGVRDSFREA